MKKLQNNFTTPELSKRLLKLGVPADSADLYWHPKNRRNEKRAGYWQRPIILMDGHTLGYEQSYSAYYDLLPCWSVGRLIEIITICREEIYTRLLFSRVDDHTNIENLIHFISAEIENGHIDFSKLDNYDTRN